MWPLWCIQQWFRIPMEEMSINGRDLWERSISNYYVKMEQEKVSKPFEVVICSRFLHVFWWHQVSSFSFLSSLFSHRCSCLALLPEIDKLYIWNMLNFAQQLFGSDTYVFPSPRSLRVSTHRSSVLGIKILRCSIRFMNIPIWCFWMRQFN